jgi:hypothetical protein
VSRFCLLLVKEKLVRQVEIESVGLFFVNTRVFETSSFAAKVSHCLNYHVSEHSP